MAHRFRGDGGSEGDREDIRADGDNGAGDVLEGDDIDDVPGLAGGGGAGGGVAVDRSGEHHGVLRPVGAGAGDGAHLRAGARRREERGGDAPPDGADAADGVGADRGGVGEHEAHPGAVVRAGRGGLGRGPHLHPVLHPGPALPVAPPPHPHPPPRAGPHVPRGLLLRRLRALPRAHQLPPRRPPPPRRRRSRPLRRAHQRQPAPAPPRLPAPLRPLGGTHGGVPEGLGAAARPRPAHLRLRLPRVVVVRARHPPLRPPPGPPHLRRRLHGRPHPDHLPPLRLPFLPRPRRLRPRLQRPRRPQACICTLFVFSFTNLNMVPVCRPARARAAAAVSMGAALGLGLAGALFAFSVRRHWARLFTGDPQVLRLTAAALPILALCELGNCPQTVACGVLRGTARPGVAANINLASFYLLGMPVSLAMAFFFRLGFPGLWLGLLAAQASCAFLMLYALCATDWLAQARRAAILTASATTTILPSHKDDDDLREVVIKPFSDTHPLITTITTAN